MTKYRTFVWALSLLATTFATGCGGDDSAASTSGDAGGEAPLVAEAGFFDVPKPLRGPASAGRMFYSFHPADHAPEAAPLVVFFNGGPGTATTAFLFPFGTAPMTLDPKAKGVLKATPNPSSWTRFANVLHIDARSTGFSYAVGNPGCDKGFEDTTEGGDAIAYLVDAGDFVGAVLDFLDAHPALTKNPVVIAGESYGGQRGMLMEYLLLHYDQPLEPNLLPTDPAALLPWVHDRVQRHVDLAFPELGGKAADAAQMAKQFGTTLFIEPAFGAHQHDFQDEIERKDPILGPALKRTGVDTDDVRAQQSVADDLSKRVAAAVRDPKTLEALIGVALTTVQGLAAADRAGAKREFFAETKAEAKASEAALAADLGKLGDDDAYWLSQSSACSFENGGAGDDLAIALIPELRVFITHAVYDATVDTNALLDLWRDGDIGVTLDAQSPVDAARPGVVRLSIGTGKNKHSGTFRFPTYQSGHEVTLSEPGELAADAEDWLRSEGLVIIAK